jgi:hypothetical protein
MLFNDRTTTDLLFTYENELWDQELTRQFGAGAETCRRRREGRGEPGTPLRKAYDARERVYQSWLIARGLGDFRFAPPQHRPEPLDVVWLLRGGSVPRQVPHWH